MYISTLSWLHGTQNNHKKPQYCAPISHNCTLMFSKKHDKEVNMYDKMSKYQAIKLQTLAN